MKECPQTNSKFRWDKYESKQLYWVEEELEAEWEKTTSKMRRAETEYQASVGVGAAFENSLAPVDFTPDAAGVEGYFHSPKIKTCSLSTGFVLGVFSRKRQCNRNQEL